MMIFILQVQVSRLKVIVLVRKVAKKCVIMEFPLEKIEKKSVMYPILSMIPILLQ